MGDLTLPFFVDKVVHGALYFVLGLALAWSWYRGNAAIPVSVFILMGSGYGVFDEWHQSFVPGRVADIADLIADGVGATVTVFGLWLWRFVSHASG